MTSAPRFLYAMAGVAAGFLGIAVSQALTALLGIRASPSLAVAEAIIEITPGVLVESLIELVGVHDKPILVTGVVVGVVALSAFAGVLTQRGRALAMAVFMAMGAIGATAVLTRPGSGPFDVVPVVAGTLTWMIALTLLVDRLPRDDRPHDARPGEGRPRRERRESEPPSRRGFLVAAGATVVGAAVLGVAGELLGRARRGIETARSLLRLPVASGVVPEGADFRVADVEPWRTPNADFYRIDTALVLPTVDPTEWRLRIHGMVERELTVSYEDLVARELTEDWVTLNCVSNEVGGDLIGNAHWSGVRVAELLAEAGVRSGADAVLQTSEDGWTCGTPLEALTDDRNAMLAIAMNGEPLPVEHGFPVRMVVPGLYGYVSATKWLVDIEVSRFADIEAYWTSRGWSERGPVKTQSRIDVPRRGADVSSGTLRVGGSAWAQRTGIERVEIRLDGGAWRQAELGRVPNVDTWVQWSTTVEVAPGDHTLAVRATDRSGYTQTGVRTDVVPDGATGWHAVDFTAT